MKALLKLSSGDLLLPRVLFLLLVLSGASRAFPCALEAAAEDARNQGRLRLNHQRLFLGLPSRSCAVDVGATGATGSSAKRKTLHEHTDASASATSTL
jgi:hypothetical protein